MKKNGDANNNPIIMFIVAIIMTLGGGACAVLAIVNKLETLVLVLGIILCIIGIYVFVYSIMRVKAIKAYNEVLNDPNAYVTEATFIKSKLSSYSSTSVGAGGINVPVKANIYKKIIYEYKDENGEQHTVTSTNSFVPKQAAFLEDKRTFKIKCKGKISVIIEELPEMDKNYNL